MPTTRSARKKAAAAQDALPVPQTALPPPAPVPSPPEDSPSPPRTITAIPRVDSEDERDAGNPTGGADSPPAEYGAIEQEDDEDDTVLGPDEWPPTPRSTSQRLRDAQQWPYKKNLALAKAVSAYNPYIAEHGFVTDAWREVQCDMREAGYDIRRTDTLRKHMDFLLGEQKRNDDKASRKSGASEPADELTHLLSDLNALIKDSGKKATTARGRAKANMEREAGAQLRDAAMRGIVDRETLVDVSELPGATAREKSGQRKKRRRSTSPSSSDKENAGAGSSKRGRKKRVKIEGAEDGAGGLIGVLEDMNSADQRLLESMQAAQQAAEAKQDAYMQKVDQLLTVLTTQREDTRSEEQKREERRQERRERDEDFIRMMSAMQQLQRPATQ